MWCLNHYIQMQRSIIWKIYLLHFLIYIAKKNTIINSISDLEPRNFYNGSLRKILYLLWLISKQLLQSQLLKRQIFCHFSVQDLWKIYKEVFINSITNWGGESKPKGDIFCKIGDRRRWIKNVQKLGEVFNQYHRKYYNPTALKC